MPFKDKAFEEKTQGNQTIVYKPTTMGVIRTNDAANASYNVIAPIFESKIGENDIATGNFKTLHYYMKAKYVNICPIGHEGRLWRARYG